MGTDIHGPWIEADSGRRSEHGQGDWHCIAELDYPLFNRDYLLFDILNGMRHGVFDYTVQPQTRGLPKDLSHSWFRHSWTWDDIHQVWVHPNDYEGMNKYYKAKYGEDSGYWGGHFGFTWMTLDEVRKTQEVYMQVGEERRCSPEGVAEAKMLAEKDEARARGEKVGMIAIKGHSIIPERHRGLDLAILIMEWAQKEQPESAVRMSYCFDN